MFAPFKVSDFHGKVISTYKGAAPMSAGALVDIDPSDTSGITGSIGFDSLTAGSVTLATIAPASNGGYAPTGADTNAVAAANFGRELGVAIPTMNATGPTLQERILELASSYMTVPVGAALAVFVPAGGDIIATDQFVGNLAGDNALPGYLNLTNTANFLAPCGIYQGRFRLVQTSDAVRARYVGTTTVNGALVGLFQFAS